MLTFLKSNRIVWIPCIIFLFSLLIPVLFLSQGNSYCHTSPFGLDQSGDTYIFTDQDSAGCFIKGLESKINFTVGSFAEKENVLTVFTGDNKSGEWRIRKGIQNVSIDSKSSISDLRFHFRDPVSKKGEVLLFQKKTLEYRIYHETILVILIVSLAILIVCFKRLLGHVLSLFAILWFISYSLSFLMLKTWPVPYIGDEPHYLLLGESLIEDNDLLLENQYEKNKVSLFFRKFDHHTIFIEGLERPVHYPLLSLYISPIFLNQKGKIQAEPQLMGKVLMVLVHSLGTAFLAFLLLRKLRFKFEYLLIPPLVFGLPWFAYSNQIFPEVAAGALIFGSYIALTETNRLSSSFWLPVLFIVFPFLHIKLGLVSFFLVLYWMYINRGEKSKVLIGSALYGAGILLFLLYNYFLYRGISPYGQKDVLLKDIFFRYMAYLFDADRGIFSLNPILFFFFIGLIVLIKRNFIQGLFLTAIVVVGHLPNVFHTNIWLGTCPYGRYWIAVYPLIAFYSMDGIRFVLDYLDTAAMGKKIIFYFVSVFLLFLSVLQMVSFLNAPENYYTQFKKTLVASSALSHVIPISIDKIYYSFFISETKLRLTYWIAGLILFILVGLFIPKKADRS